MHTHSTHSTHIHTHTHTQSNIIVINCPFWTHFAVYIPHRASITFCGVVAFMSLCKGAMVVFISSLTQVFIHTHANAKNVRSFLSEYPSPPMCYFRKHHEKNFEEHAVTMPLQLCREWEPEVPSPPQQRSCCAWLATQPSKRKQSITFS